MKLKDIISVSGKPGLYKVVAQSKSGFIVENLGDQKRIPVAGNEKISSLNDISVFTTGDDMPLREVFLRMQNHGDKIEINSKDDEKKLKSNFKAVIAEYDEARVYTSDIKKIFNWFTILNGKIDFNEKEEESDESLLNKAEEKKVAHTHHEGHGPKTEGAKIGQQRTRKKV